VDLLQLWNDFDPNPLVGTSIFLAWCAEPTLAISRERLPKGPYQKNTPPAVRLEPAIHRLQILLPTELSWPPPQASCTCMMNIFLCRDSAIKIEAHFWDSMGGFLALISQCESDELTYQPLILCPVSFPPDHLPIIMLRVQTSTTELSRYLISCNWVYTVSFIPIHVWFLLSGADFTVCSQSPNQDVTGTFGFIRSHGSFSPTSGEPLTDWYCSLTLYFPSDITLVLTVTYFELDNNGNQCSSPGSLAIGTTSDQESIAIVCKRGRTAPDNMFTVTGENRIKFTYNRLLGVDEGKLKGFEIFYAGRSVT